jgi:glycosyltransferase involved in cell wall biosynthesis
MANLHIKRFSARRHDVKRKLKDFLKRHVLRRLPPSPPMPRVQSGLVSCLMITRGNIDMVKQSLASFNDQTWPERELVMVTVNVTAALQNLIQAHGHGRVTLVEAHQSLTLGDQRNLSMAHCRGEFVCIWDDDDLYSPERVKTCLEALLRSGVDAVFLDRLLLWWPARERLAISFSRLWENTMLARRTAIPAYVALSQNEDAAMVDWLTYHSSYALIDAPELYGYRVTGQNQCSTDHFERLFFMSDELTDERYKKMLQSACFCYAYPESFSSVSLKQKPPPLIEARVRNNSGSAN